MNKDGALLLVGSDVARHELPADEVALVQLPPPLTLGANTVVLDLVDRAEPVLDRAAPLFVLAPTPAGWRPYTQMSFTGHDALFVALDGPCLIGDASTPGTLREWVAELSRRHRAHAPRLNNHQRWFHNACPDLEIEHKFTLTGDWDIWTLATHTLRLVADGGLPGWIPEHGNNGGFEQWDFLTHIFEITSPAHERGDIAFIHAVDGSWIIRRKWPTAMAEVRCETLVDGVHLGPEPDLARVVVDRYGVVPAWGGCYRRVRYNVMIESLDTGHVFSIMFDRCTDASGPAPPLQQVEVEYVRSRTLRWPGREEVMKEFGSLVDVTRRFLKAWHVATREDHLSKLDWLRSAAAEADRPP